MTSDDTRPVYFPVDCICNGNSYLILSSTADTNDR